MRLYINIDHVATVRQARRADEPDPLEAAALAEAGGADGITVHLREDRRHIQDRDVVELAKSVTTVLNLELSTATEIIDLAERLAPHQATFVPEKREELTTEGGLDLTQSGAARDALAAAVRRLQDRGVRVSLFIDPTEESIERSRDLGADAVELHTGDYANHYRDSGDPLRRLQTAARLSASLGLGVHAGHGLTYRNVQPVAAIREIEELNIGHSVVSRSVMKGMSAAVSEMRHLIDSAR